MKISFCVIFLCMFCFLYGGYKQSVPIVFYHEYKDHPDLKLLRKKYEFDEYISSGKTDLEKIMLLKHWVLKKLKYARNFKCQHLRNSLRILELSDGGEPMLCTNFSAVFMQAALSMGWTARYFFLRKPTGEQHAANDIWWKDHKKWVFIDTTWGLHVEKNNVPLSLVEIRNEWIKNSGRDLTYVYGAGSEEKRFSWQELPVRSRFNRAWVLMPPGKKWASYSYEIAMVARNDFFSYRDGSGKDIWGHIYILRDALNRNDKKWPFRNRAAITPAQMFHDADAAQPK